MSNTKFFFKLNSSTLFSTLFPTLFSTYFSTYKFQHSFRHFHLLLIVNKRSFWHRFWTHYLKNYGKQCQEQPTLLVVYSLGIYNRFKRPTVYFFTNDGFLLISKVWNLTNTGMKSALRQPMDSIWNTYNVHKFQTENWNKIK